MSKRKILTFALSLFATVLTACDPGTNPESKGITFDDLNVASNYIASKEFYVDSNGNQAYTATYISGDPNTLGDVGVFVLPVEFEDAPASELPGGAEFQLQKIEEAFFGDPATNPYLTESLKSYYAKSSYGKMNIVGDVADSWWNCGMTINELAEVYVRDYNNGTSGSAPFKVLREYYMERTGLSRVGYITVEGYNWANTYDKNRDGFIDCIAMIYSAHSYPNMSYIPTSLSQAYQDTFWAFTHSDFYQKPWLTTNVTDPTLIEQYTQLPNNYVPCYYRFLWMSWDQIWFGGYYNADHTFTSLSWKNASQAAQLTNLIASGEALLDTHTIIHESGHALCAFEDYYTYDYDGYMPAGYLDMMDHNLGDHNAYSKMLAQWITPTVVTEPGVYTLPALQDTNEGSVIIIKARGLEYRNTPLDEYIMLELYTPTGLNERDSIYPLEGYNTYTDVGVEVYHVDSRFGLYSYNETSQQYVFQRYSTALSMGDRQRTMICADNTSSRSVDPNFKLLHLLESSGDNTFANNGYATNETLFKVGDSFGVRTFRNFTMNSGDAFGWTFEITSIENNVATITVKEA